MGLGYSTGGLVHNVSSYISGRKRKFKDCEDEEVNKIIDIALHTPKRKKLISTAQYIYKALFEEGKNSDVTVCALGEDFMLHKVYLCQSPYFASMFGGSWLEATKKYIDIDVVDPLITAESLRVVFGSLYNSEIILNPLQIVPTLATATMFQLDGLIEKCTEVMLETINPKTSLLYYNAACQYGDRKLQEVFFRWFLVNLMTYYFTPPTIHLRCIPVPLMTKLISHPDLIVMQTEYSVYVLLKYWVYLLTHPHACEESVSSKEVSSFFVSRKNEPPFLLSEEGRQFIPVYQGLRLQNIISHQMDIELVLHDNIIPQSWLTPVILQQWRTVLRVNHNDDKGPCEIADEVFLNTSLRCGRILMVNERHVWRWTGFHFGIDLLMMTDGLTISVKRNHRPEFEQLLTFQTTRRIAIRVTVYKLNEQRQISYTKQSEVLTLPLTKGEEVKVMILDKDLEYPIIIAANILYTSPDVETTHQEELVQTIR